MELTVDQMLQQGVAAHNAGNPQEAERLYRAILQVQPKHPDANHNLGLIAVSMSQSDVALPFFTIAIDVNPNIEQFWLSYIEALIAERQFENAKQAIKKGKKKGVAKEKLKILTQKLVSVKAGNNLIQAQSQAETQKLLDHYQSGQYGDAEKLAISITEQFPEHQFAWKVLAAVFKQTGRISESLTPSQKAVQLAPQDAEAHSNLGLTLKELGRLEEAEASLRQAIALKPDYAEAHNNLGITLHELGRLEEAVAICGQAIALKPDYVEARYNLGSVLDSLNRLEAAAEQFTLIEFEKSKDYLLRCLYKLGRKPNFYKQLDHMLNQGENNALIGSLISQSNIRYGMNRHNPFCNEPLKYVLKTDLLEQCDFKNIFVKGAAQVLDDPKVQHRGQALLTNGIQTPGNVFNQAGPVKDVIQKIIYSEIEKYRMRFKDSAEGLITSWPADYSLFGWFVNMKSGGELDAHMHENGWVSGSIYINVPPKSDKGSGNLVVSLNDEKNQLGGEDSIRSIDVITGSLCIFPSSLHHYTIPFESTENRVVLAFDVLSKN